MVTFQIVINKRITGAVAAPLRQFICRGKTPSFCGANSFRTDVPYRRRLYMEVSK
ncbi:hypothetical protein GCM10009865_43310 [Aeromicrobium ponti]